MKPISDPHHKADRKLLFGSILLVILLWLTVALLPIASYVLPAWPPRHVNQLKSILGQYGTFGDTFGLLTCLFTGMAFIYAGYAVALQRRQLQEQRNEIEKNEKRRVETAEWERQMAMLNTINFLAQASTAKYQALVAVHTNWADREVNEQLLIDKATTKAEVDAYIGMLKAYLTILGNQPAFDKLKAEAIAKQNS